MMMAGEKSGQYALPAVRGDVPSSYLGGRPRCEVFRSCVEFSSTQIADGPRFGNSFQLTKLTLIPSDSLGSGHEAICSFEQPQLAGWSDLKRLASPIIPHCHLEHSKCLRRIE